MTLKTLLSVTQISDVQTKFVPNFQCPRLVKSVVLAKHLGAGIIQPGDGWGSPVFRMRSISNC